MKLKNRNILITGGASGIGKVMGRMALERGANHLVIWDINSTNIEATIKELSPLGKVNGYVVDVANVQAVETTYKLVCEECGKVDILINCAGIITSNKTFDELTIEEIDRTIKINTLAPMYVARVMLPDMLKRECGHICNIASAGGMLGNPKMSVYGASKWGTIGWSESLRIEMDKAKKGVHVTTITPYYIKTGMFEGVKSSIIPILKPEYVARKVLGAIERNKSFRGIPFGYHFIRFCQAILPLRVFDWFFGEVIGIYHTMDKFTGRK